MSGITTTTDKTTARRSMKQWLAVLLGALIVAGCAGGPNGSRRASLEDVAPDFRTLTGWIDDNHAEAVPALRQSCVWFNRVKADREIGPGGMAGRAADWRPMCAAARDLSDQDSESARQFFEKWLAPVSLGGGKEGLFTGYFEVDLKGSWSKTAEFNVPLYRSPGSGSMPERARIVAGALAGRGLELMWVSDPVDAFILEIQGSGRVTMPDGQVVRVGYGGQNGHTYYPIGRHLIDQGFYQPDQMNLPVIRQWLHEHPRDAQRVMNLNPSYVFFKIERGEAAKGAANVPLTPGRSMAVDTSYVPLGVPLWLDLRQAPTSNGVIRRLVMAQDTGGAIKGAVRGDLFWGRGDDAVDGAGRMKARGRYAMLAPRAIVERKFTAAR
ncbi:membrane-bound lytic murein transglycosylase A [Azospirillaceae bacterium]